jgi:uncharacterized protein YecE (DUF72 family)
MIRIGPAGWSYDDWAGIVYPKPKPKGFDPLTYLAGYFDMIEVNSTFYRPTTPEVAKRWVERVAEHADFRFTAKLWRRFTHQRKEAWTRAEVREVRAGLDPLADAGRLGAVLLQFPWSFRNTEESVAWLDDLISSIDHLPLVVEVRHESWNTPGFLEHLRERGVGLANIDQPVFRDSIKPSAHATSSVGYVRVHGRNYKDWWRDKAEPHERYDYLYPATELRPWIARAKKVEAASETDDTYVVTNNHYRGKAVANALMIESMVTKKKVAGPADLFEEYGDVLRSFVRPDRQEEPARRAS